MRKPQWIRELAEEANGAVFVSAIEKAVEANELSWKEVEIAENHPEWVLNVPVEIPDSMRRYVFAKLNDTFDEEVNRRLRGVLDAGISVNRIRKAISGIVERHTSLSQKDCIEAIQQNAYVLGQVLSPEEMLLIDKAYRSENNEQSRIRAFLNAACEKRWQSHEGEIKIRQNSSVVRDAAFWLAKFGSKNASEYEIHIEQNWKQIIPEGESVEWSYPMRFREEKVRDRRGNEQIRKRVVPSWIHFSEWQAAEAITEHAMRPKHSLPPGWDEFLNEPDEHGNVLDVSQKNALTAMWQDPVSLVTGGPGSGKTTLIRALKRAVDRFAMDGYVEGFAPTGIAAKRLSKAAHIEANTIHHAFRMYSIRSHIEKGTFERPSKYRNAWIVVDEAGMCDIHTFHAVVWGLPSGHKGLRLIFMGDVNQLGPVGIGKPFRTLIQHNDWSMFVHRLRVNHRAGEVLSDTAQSFWDENASWQWNEPHIVPMPTHNDDMRDAILKWIDEHGGIHAEKSAWQILIPYRNETEGHTFGSEEINSWLTSTPFEMGTRIIQLTNNPWTMRKNGEIGFVVDNNNQYITTDFGDEHPTTLPILDAYEQWIPAYAMTFHRAQGGEWDNVLVIFPRSNHVYHDAHGFYTAQSRPKKHLYVMAESPDEVVQAVFDHRWDKAVADPWKNKLNHTMKKQKFFDRGAKAQTPSVAKMEGDWSALFGDVEKNMNEVSAIAETKE